MDWKAIVDGHVKELFNINEQLIQTRLEICKKCPLFKVTTVGLICNSKLWVNEENVVSLKRKEGYKRGCGCRLEAKTRLPNATCTRGLW